MTGAAASAPSRRSGDCSDRVPKRSYCARWPSSAPGVREVVLVAQDLASWGLDRSAPERVARRAGTPRPIVGLVRRLAQQVGRVRLLYLYPSALDDSLIDAVLSTGVPYFDLSLQHVSRPLVETHAPVG